VSDDSLARRYWRALTGVPTIEAFAFYPREREGYGLWLRYWASLLNVRPSQISSRRSMPGVTLSTAVPRNPLTRPYVDGEWIRLPRFDRELRLAATDDIERLSASWTVAGWRFLLREAGPGQVDVLVETDREVPATLVLAVHIAGPAGDRDYFMVFVPDSPGRSVGVLRLPDVQGWIDVAIDGEQTVATLDAGDPTVLARLADSVRATPDPGMPAWAQIVASRPAGDLVRQVIVDAGR
jgi:hypothetical protein